MRFLYFLMILALAQIQSKAQLYVPVKIDTSQAKTKSLYLFINDYMKKDTISNEMWHPKYKHKKRPDNNMDWIWGQYTPKKIARTFNLELAELQKVNDTLSYFKLSAKSKPDKENYSYTNVYKYYIVEKEGKYYLDNCKPYDTDRFRKHETKNIHFYVSPFYTIDKRKMEDASKTLDALYLKFKKPHLKKPIDYFMCATEEELNNLSNIVIWDGGFGAFTNIPEAYVVAINDNPDYKHEFIHAILGLGANCFFLQEGIASLYGGTDKGKASYEDGLKELRSCYGAGKCDFDNLYLRQVQQQYSSSLTYAFAAVFCKYLIDNYGMDYFYKLYYDKEITSDNFLEILIKKTGKSKAEIKKEIEKLIGLP